MDKTVNGWEQDPTVDPFLRHPQDWRLHGNWLPRGNYSLDNLLDLGKMTVKTDGLFLRLGVPHLCFEKNVDSSHVYMEDCRRQLGSSKKSTERAWRYLLVLEGEWGKVQ